MARSEGGGERRDKTEHYRQAALLHPQRRFIMRLISGEREVGPGEVAAELGGARGHATYHLRVLARRGALKVVPRCRPAPPLYRRSSRAGWAREILGEDGE
jgi:DNA-binding transcriptional ArsR family regulator